MTIIIKYESSSGKRRYCNGLCHQAKGSVCHCCCGGRYHGAALDNSLNSKVIEHQKEIVSMLSENGEVLQAVITLL